MKSKKKKPLISKLDREASRIVRSKGYCLKCGDTTYEKLNCCHINGRTLRATRWDFDNLLCLCSTCHSEFGFRPLHFADWCKGYLGEEKYDEVKRKGVAGKKWTVDELEELLKELKEIEN